MTLLDDFNRANGALGADWGGDTARGSIVSNIARLTAASPTTVFWNHDLGTPDLGQSVDIIYTGNTSDYHNLITRGTSGTATNGTFNGYDAYFNHSGVNVAINRVIAGSFSNALGGEISITDPGGNFTARLDTKTLNPGGTNEIVRNVLKINSVTVRIIDDGASTRRTTGNFVGERVFNNTTNFDNLNWFDLSSTATTYPYVVQSKTGVITASRSPSLTFDAAPLENDIVLFFASSQTTGHTITEPATWTNPLGAGVDVESDSHQICCVGHRVTSAEAGASTVTFTATNLYGATHTGEVHGVVVRNVDQTTMFDAGNSTFSSTNTVTPSVLASVTTASNWPLVISSVAKDATGAYSTEPVDGSSNPAYFFIATSNTNQGRATLQHYSLPKSGVTIAATNITPSAGDEYASITVALKASTSTPASVSASVVTAAVDVPARTVATGASLTTTVVTAAASAPAPTVVAVTQVNASVVTAVAETPARTVATGSSLTASVVTAVSSVPSATVATGSTVAATAVTAVGDVPSPSVTTATNATATPGVVTATAAAPTATIATGSTVTAAVATAAVDAPAPSVSAQQHANPTPTVVTAAAGFPTSTVAVGATVTASVATTTVDAPIPAVSAGGSASITATVVTAAVGVLTPTVAVGVTVTATTVTISAQAPASTASASSTATPAVVTATANTPALTVSTGSTVATSVVTAASSVPVPTVATSVTVTASVVTATVEFPTLALSSGVTMTPEVIAIACAVLTAIVVAGFPDPNPVTLTIRERGHNTTVHEDDHTATLRERGHTITAREQR